MAYQVLARKYRPLRFSDVVGQDHVTRTLLNALAQDRIAHGYIFSGHRGIGKTTIARILASALNCQRAIGSPERPTPEPCNNCASCLEIRSGNAVDVIEIDAATNRGIDEIRELRDAARYRPARDRFKIIILDEAHQITDAAFNALLKTLEEPPEHIVFMMATTQPEDIPQTIRSRCQHFSFHAVKLDDIVGQLRRISDDEHIDVDDATLGLLAEAGDGSMRDALSIMDQAIASAPQTTDGRPHVELNEVRELMGAVSNVVFEEVLQAVHANDSAAVLSTVGRLLDLGNGPQQIARQFVRFLRNTVVAKITGLSPEADAEATGIAAELLQISTEERRRAARAAAHFSEEELSRFLAILLRTFDDLGFRQEQRLHLELGLLKLVHVQRLVPVEELLSQLGANGAPSTPKPPTPSSNAAKPAAVPPRSSSQGTPQAASPLRPAPAPSAESLAAVPRSEPSTLASRTPGAVPIPRDQGTTPTPRPEASAPPRVAAPQPAPRAQTTVAPPPLPEITAPIYDFSAPPSPIPIQTRVVADTHPTSSKAASDPSVPESAAHAPHAAKSRSPAPANPPTEVSGWAPANGTSDSAPTLEEIPAVPGIAARSASSQGDPVAVADLTSAAPASSPEALHLQASVVKALLATKGQTSAAEYLEDATWMLNGNTLEVQTTLSKTMLPVVFNAEADKIIKATLRDGDAGPLQVKLLPGAPAASTNTKKSRKAAAGSAAELAEKHPLVQEARRLFSAEISNVIDLRKD